MILGALSLSSSSRLPDNSSVHVRNAGNIAAGSRKGSDNADPDRIADTDEYNGNRRGSLFSRQRALRGPGKNHIGLKTHKLSGVLLKKLSFSFCPTIIDDQVFTLHVTVITQTLEQGFPAARIYGRRTHSQVGEPRYLRRLLRFGEMGQGRNIDE